MGYKALLVSCILNIGSCLAERGIWVIKRNRNIGQFIGELFHMVQIIFQINIKGFIPAARQVFKKNETKKSPVTLDQRLFYYRL